MRKFNPESGPTGNELLRDALIRRHIRLLKYAKHLRTQVMKIIDRTEKPLRSEVEDRLAVVVNRDFSMTTHKRLNVLARSVSRIRGAAFDQVLTTITDDMRRLGPTEASYLDQAIKDSMPVHLRMQMPDVDDLEGITDLYPIQGHLLKDWISALSVQDTNRIMGAIRSAMALNYPLDKVMRMVIGTGAIKGTDGVVQITRNNLASLTTTTVLTVASRARQLYYGANRKVTHGR